MAIFPRVGEPRQFDLHQCSCDRSWTLAEVRLFRMIGLMAAEALGSLLLAGICRT